MKSFDQIKFLIDLKFRRLLLKMLGNYAYRSYLHYKILGPKAISDSSQQYLAALPNYGAGIGHQLANWISGYWYAKKWNMKFAHIPFSSKEWESFFGFGIGEAGIPQLKKEGWIVRRIPLFHEKNQEEIDIVEKIMSSYSGKKVIFLCEQDQFYRDQFGVAEEIQDKFLSAPARNNETIVFSKDNFNIAIHVRRGDILQDPTNPNLVMRYLSNNYFEKVLLDSIVHFGKIQTKPIHVYFFSQGHPEDYPEFSGIENLHWCLDWSARDSFLHMAKADALITSKSSFSYKPALLNREGIKICPKFFWHGYPQTDDWVLVENDGAINWTSNTNPKE